MKKNYWNANIACLYSKTEVHAESARELFMELGEYRNSEKCLAELLAEHIDLTDAYKQAYEYCENGSWDSALEILSGMDPENESVKELAVKCYESKYKAGLEYWSSKNYAEAFKEFNSIKDYKSLLTICTSGDIFSLQNISVQI